MLVVADRMHVNTNSRQVSYYSDQQGQMNRLQPHVIVVYDYPTPTTLHFY